MDGAKRNPFFLPSGFEPQEAINILEAAGENRKRLDKIRKRKRAERKLLKQVKYNDKHKLYDKIIEIHKLTRAKKIKITEMPDQIQRGFNLAAKWGWDGIDRPYVPVIMSVFGGNKRKKG